MTELSGIVSDEVVQNKYVPTSTSSLELRSPSWGVHSFKMPLPRSNSLPCPRAGVKAGNGDFCRTMRSLVQPTWLKGGLAMLRDLGQNHFNSKWVKWNFGSESWVLEACTGSLVLKKSTHTFGEVKPWRTIPSASNILANYFACCVASPSGEGNGGWCWGHGQTGSGC